MEPSAWLATALVMAPAVAAAAVSLLNMPPRRAAYMLRRLRPTARVT